MESNDMSKNGSELPVKTPDDIKDREEPGPSRPHWKDVFKEVVQRIILAFRNLWRKIINAYTSLFKADGEVSPLDDIKGAFRHIPVRAKGLGYAIFGLIFIVYLLSGVYTVKPGEEAVARLFGKEIKRVITEGIHYHLPWPFEAVEKVNVMEIRRIDVGMPSSPGNLLFPKQGSSASPAMGEHSGHEGRGANPGASRASSSVPTSTKNQFFTGDENILDIRMSIQYRIKDASDYLFSVDSPDSLIPYTTRAAVTEIFGGKQVDNLLTTAKSQIQKRIALKAQHTLDDYGAGLQIVNVNLQAVNPPKEVAQAFRDVASAREEKEEKINKAQGYWNTVVPEARGKAHKVISEAEGYREEAINRAQGDAEKFTTMLKEYQMAEDITEYRLYLETIEKVLAKTKKIIVDSKKERVNLKFVK